MKLTIGRKLGAGFGAILVLMIVSAAVAFYKIREMNGSVAKVVDEAFPTVAACDAMLNGMNHSMAALRGYLILGADSRQAEFFKGERKEAWTNIDAAFTDLQRHFQNTTDPDDKKDFALIQATLPEVRKAQEKVEEIGHTSENIKANHLLLTQAIPASDRILESMTRMIDAEESQASSSERIALLKQMADFRLSIARSMAGIEAYLISRDARFRDSFEQQWELNQRAFEAIETQASVLAGTQPAEWIKLKKLRSEFEPLPPAIVAAHEARDGNQANFLTETDSAPKGFAIRDALERLRSAAAERMGQDRKDLDAASSAVTGTLGAATLIAILTGSVVAIALSRRIVDAIQGLLSRVQAVSAGDLTGQAVRIGSDDEVGELGQGFNGMVASLKDLAGQIHLVTENINSSCAQIQASAQQQASSTREQAATVQEITSTMQEVGQSGDQIVEKAKQVATSAEATSAATQSGIRAVQDTTRTMEGIREQVEEVAENIVALSEKTQAVGEIVATVNDIAEQSNLLALNASIEAADAGGEGRRFAVVANEMKNLADQAKDCTVQVRTILGDIQKGINSSVMLTEEAVKRVESGKRQADVSEQTIREMNATTEQSIQAFQQILGAANQQQIGFDQVTQGMQDIRQAAEQTASGTEQLNQAVANLTALSRQLRTAVGRYRI